MDRRPIPDAARLAADAPPSGVLPPRQSGLGPAWLDLRHRQASASTAATARVVRAMTPNLVVNDEARLFVSAGPTPGHTLARTAADALRLAGQDSTQIAVLKGEDVLSRLEEFAQADPQALGERWREATAAWALPPAALLQEATELGAPIVISHAADQETVRRAVSLDSDQQTPAGRLLLRATTGYRLSALLGISDEDLRREVDQYAPDGITRRLTPCGDHTALVVDSVRRDPLEEFCERLALVTPAAPTPLSDRLVARYDEFTASVAPELLEFALDIRSAGEWLDG